MGSRNSKKPHGFVKPKLSIEDVEFIKATLYIDRQERKAAGFKLGTPRVIRRLAERFGVSFSTIEKIRKGERWSSVKKPRWAVDFLASRFQRERRVRMLQEKEPEKRQRHSLRSTRKR